MFFESFYRECYENHTGIAVFLIDMDRLKYVNDNIGHDEGDYCLCTIGHAMKESAKNGEICIRSGGDEFIVLAKNYDDQMVESYMTHLRHAIALKKRTDGKAYELSVSIGCYMQIPTEEYESAIGVSEKYLRYADTEMYIEKKEHHKEK
jgi:diguanylate cyclase (GGDEF)-like protein